MRVASCVSASSDPDAALAEAADALREGLDGPPDLLVVFASASLEPSWRPLADGVQRAFPEALRLGCTARGVIGGGRELDEGPGLALLGARLPGVRLRPFHVGDGDRSELPRAPAAAAVILADPFSVHAESLLGGLDEALEGAPVVGGLASAGDAPGGNRLWLGSATWRSGAVGVALEGPLRVETRVAQGCRPVGDPMFVTRAEANVILELDGRRPMDVLQELYARSDALERARLRGALQLGLALPSGPDRDPPDPFLIRNLLGADSASGALHVGGEVRAHQVVQFHVRDARAAAADLEAHLREAAVSGPPPGALLFSCLGRGRALFGVPDHDSGLFRRHVGEVPLAGFFGHGEIGPVAGRSFLHGYTSVFALLRPAA